MTHDIAKEIENDCWDPENADSLASAFLLDKHYLGDWIWFI